MLARELGYTLEGLRKAMPASEMALWLAFYAVESRERAQDQRNAGRKAKLRGMGVPA